ncbi:ABC transporter substrate-binding protein [Methanolobus profundi]|uniref:Iron complex transport system substrate-binding protein n=1 Tax=Methanolobus profundi TaxID=487685 RepID=A0A1I4PHF8_9EURY|nr:ABC transporter substrate-binding protein [Methanolobus profundi]SFM27060.1 iron complex transport system substrate-binding protein [Methanolobus profundi]
MKKHHVFILLILATCILFSGCIGDSSQEENSLIDDDYNSSMDYFPHKINIEYAQDFSVEYHNNYKLVTVTEQDNDNEYSYVLVQKGTPVPEHDPDSIVVEIPVESVAALSTTHLPALEIIGKTDTIKAVSSFAYINSIPVRQMIENETIDEVGTGSYMNTEAMIKIEPDVIFTLTTGIPYDDDHIDNLIDLGLKPVVVDEYKETSALGQAEWIKFISLFFNAEEDASEYFDQVASDYNEMVKVTRSIEDRPVVMSGMAWQGTWYVPGGNSLIAQYIDDAGAVYFWSDNNNTATVTLDFEAVFDQGKEADYWISSGMWNNTEELEAEDVLYLEFGSVNNGNVYTSYYRINENGGNDYYESGIVRPDLVLADFVKMFHPELVPDHELVYHKRIE